MRTRIPRSWLILVLLGGLALGGCPDDDDDSSVDDDDVTQDDDDATADDDDVTPDDDDVTPDDDDVTPDDDDVTPDDDDATSVDCSAPPNVQATVTVTDAVTGLPSTTLTADGLSVDISVQNLGGGSETQSYNSSCIFSWGLYDMSGAFVSGGPDCLTVITTQTYVCEAAPITQGTTVDNISALTGLPLASGTYSMVVDSFHYGISPFAINVP